MLRLVIIITGLGIGGAEHALLKLLSRVDRSRFQISLIVLGREDALEPAFRAIGIEPIRLGLAAGRWPLGAVGRLFKTVRALNPDILQGWMYHGNLAASFVGARLSGVPVCWSVRDTPDAAHGHSRFTRLVIRFSGWYVGRVSRIFNVSAHSAAYCAAHFGWPPTRTEVLPNGIDTALFWPDPVARAALRETLGVAENQPVIGMVARWSPVKNHALFLEAAARLRVHAPQTCFVLVGKGLEAGNAELMAIIERLGLGEAVHLLGARHDVERLYPAFDIAALSSRSEGFPNVLAEAMSCGVPVVSTDVGDARAIVGPGGTVVPARADALVFAQALGALLDAPDRQQKGLAARAHIEQHYALDAVAGRLQQRYCALAAANARRSPT